MDLGSQHRPESGVVAALHMLRDRYIEALDGERDAEDEFDSAVTWAIQQQ